MKIRGVSINLNDYVWVIPTDRGWEIFNDFYDDLELDPTNYRKPGIWQRFQLWELMHMYGPHCIMGLRGGFFNRMEIHLTDPTTDD